MKKVATIILNRNLPEVTDALYDKIKKYNDKETEIFVVDASTDERKISSKCTWWANWEETIDQGLRTARGFNLALYNLWKEGRFKEFDYFLLLPNDVEFEEKPFISILTEEMELHNRVGIMAPCLETWGESKLLLHNETKYFWYIEQFAWFLRREYVEDVMALEDVSYMNFLYDGTNFRGYESDIELIVKGYANDWAAAITNKVKVSENEQHLLTKSEYIQTDPKDVNMEKYIDEGKKWLRKKYGFNSRWTMQMYAKFFYDKFFEFNPELKEYKI